MRRRPSSPRAMPRTSCTVRSSCPSRRRASPNKRVPSGVSSTRRRLRANSTTPRRCSRARIARDSGGCEICSAAAARPKCNCSATAKKYRNCHNSGSSIPAEYYRSTATALDCPRSSSENRASKEDHCMATTPANRRSRLITHGVARSPNRAMLRAVGFGDGDFEKPIVGVANGHSTMNPCNAGIQPLIDRAMAALEEAGAKPQVFGVPTVTDGIGMGTEAMKYSLVSREVIADAIETSVNGQAMDGVLVVGGCDKNMPGGVMAMARMNVPAIYVYGGTIKPGKWKGKDLTIVSAFEAVGSFTAGKMNDEDFQGIEKNACPSVGACGGMYTANTMSSSFEALGVSLLGSSQMAAPDSEKADSAAESARVLVEAVKKNLRPRDIITRKSIENAIALVMATGGSTNAVLHYLAIASAAGVKWGIDDFERMRRKVPVLCDLKPSGRYVAVDFHRAGGVPQVLKILLQNGVLNGECITIHGKSMAQMLKDVPAEPRADQDVIRPWSEPLYRDGHLAILKGNLAPEGCVAKITGLKNPVITGPARVFDSENDCMTAIMAKRIKPGDVIVIRYEGPKGGPGMQEMLAPTSALIGQGLGERSEEHTSELQSRLHLVCRLMLGKN